jgi:hypothetical protein
MAGWDLRTMSRNGALRLPAVILASLLAWTSAFVTFCQRWRATASHTLDGAGNRSQKRGRQRMDRFRPAIDSCRRFRACLGTVRAIASVVVKGLFWAG